MRKHFCFVWLLILVISCTNSEKKKSHSIPQLTIAVAANVQFAIKELETLYEANTDTQLEIIIGSSGKLTAQITQGAPYDLLISANMKYPETLFEKGFAAAAPEVYAYGNLVLWTMQDLDLKQDLSILNNQNIKKIAIANPKNAPYGEQALQAFQNTNLLKQIEAKLVYGESIAQTNQYILSQACDVGITAKSVVLSPDLRNQGHWIDVPVDTYEKIAQGVVMTKHGQAQHSAAVEDFYRFLFSAPAQTILKKYGYQVIEN